jgi:hypothetical protein
MLQWVRKHWVSLALFVCFALTAGYALWLRPSKSHFALAVVAALCSTASALMSFLSGPVPKHGVDTLWTYIKNPFGLSNAADPFFTHDW